MEVWKPNKEGFNPACAFDTLRLPIRFLLNRFCLISPRHFLLLLSLKHDCRRLEKRLGVPSR